MPRGVPRAKNLEARENQLIAKAVDLVEQRMNDGSATAAEILHYLKLGTTRERLEKEKLQYENALLQAKRESIQATQRADVLYEEAIQAMRSYSGLASEDYES